VQLKSGTGMDERPKIAIGGIKFSEELVQLRLSDNKAAARLLNRASAGSINFPFLCHNSLCRPAETTFCVQREDFGRLQQAADSAGLSLDRFTVTPGVGTITVFPHRNSLALLGLISSLFAREGYPIHSLSSSISVIAVNTSYALLDTIAMSLQSWLQLPDNHAPFRQTVRLEQLSG